VPPAVDPSLDPATEAMPVGAPGPDPLVAPPGASGEPVRPGVLAVGPLLGDITAARPARTRYSRYAKTPLPYAALALTSVGVLLALVRWGSSGEIRPGEPEVLTDLNSAWWSVSQLLLPHDTTPLLVTVERAAIVLAASAVTLALVLLWVGKVGRNVVPGEGAFGSWLALAALPAWWILPLTLGTYGSSSIDTRLDLLLRTGTALIIFAVQFLLLRWPLHNRTWRAGHLPGDLASLALWVVEMVPWGMFLASAMFQLVAAGERLSRDVAWEPTPAMVDWGTATSLGSLVAIAILLIVVSVRQHQGIALDRQEDAEAREAARALRMPAPVR
jgi:hypothetical protein